MRDIIALAIFALFWAPVLFKPSLLKRPPLDWIPLDDGGIWDPNTGEVFDLIEETEDTIHVKHRPW